MVLAVVVVVVVLAVLVVMVVVVVVVLVVVVVAVVVSVVVAFKQKLPEQRCFMSCLNVCSCITGPDFDIFYAYIVPPRCVRY